MSFYFAQYPVNVDYMLFFHLLQLLLGLMQADKSIINSKEMAAQLFVHEASRVFHDRLIEPSEKNLFYQLLSKELQNHLQVCS